MNSTLSETPLDINSPEVKEFVRMLEIPNQSYSFVTRKQWRAAKPRRTTRIKHPVTRVVVNFHWGQQKCLDRESCKDLLQDEQRRLIRECGEDDIPVQYVLFNQGDDGTVYEGRGWHSVSSRKLGYPIYESYGYDRIDVVFIGNYEDGDRPQLVKPVIDLMEHGVVMKYVKKDWALVEEPFPFDKYPDDWPPKRKGPPSPRLWW